MSSFTTPLIVETMPDGKNWKLYRKFRYHVKTKFSRTIISVPRNFVTDFASIPRFLFFLPDWATYSKAPVLHDWLYLRKVTTRKEADDLFLEAMLVDWRHHKSRHIIAYIEYYAVRLFGWLMWNKKRGRK